ncbi:ATP-binding protein [Larkinella insperata]|uniref:Oxygen sensor histidine kinase NreB n=1 Tax=Larkinella insperata TaxID=332158 RepID=A0ABW3PZ45_9BACT|nr:sensor histidine kinase [Larkinella insperata]
MKQVLTAVVWLLAPVFAFSQAPDPASLYADSLLKLARQAQTDSVKIRHYLEISNFWSDRDTSKAFDYLREAQRLMPEKDAYYRGLRHFYTAGIYFGVDRERAKQEYQRTETLLKKYNHGEAYRFRARTWNNFGILLQATEQEKAYMAILLNKAIPLAQKAHDTLLVAEYYHNVALVLMNATDYAKADQYYQRALNGLAAYPGSHEKKLTAFVNAAKNAVYSRAYNRAKSYVDSAREQAAAIPHSLYLPAFYRTEGNYFRHVRRYPEALASFDRGLAVARELRDDFYVADILFEKCILFQDAGDYRRAKPAILEAYRYFEKAGNTHNRRLLLKELSETDAKLGDYRSALQWLNQYTALSDSVFEVGSAVGIAELEKKFQTVEKENEILKLRDQNHQQQSRIERSRLSITLLAAGLLVMLLLSYLGWKLFRKNRETARQHEELHQQELKAIRHREKINQYNAMLQGQEQERNRIARDLHDGLGGMLAGVKLKLSSIATKQPDAIKQPDMELYKVINQLDQSVDELRRIARNMMPESLLYMGLEPALRDLCAALDSDRTAVQFQAFDLRETYDQALLITVYRIVQELLTNAVKHAKARTIVVQCSENENHLYITVEDDGVGFDPKTARHGKGIGLSNIENRVTILNGTVDVDSKTGEGTTFHIDIPLNGN